MEKIILFAIPMMIAVPLTAWVCHIRIVFKRRISFGTVLFSAFVVTFLWLGFATRGDIYTVDFWTGANPKSPDRVLMLKVVGFTMLTCILPALGVVHYYQRQGKNDEQVAQSEG